MVSVGDRIGMLVLLEPVWVRNKRQRETQWRIRCDCGREYVARVHNLRKQKSCGCATRSKWSVRLRDRLRNHISRAKKRYGGVWDFTKEEAFALFTANCHYCGVQGTDRDPLGLDRVDSSVGYTKSNCVPCCGTCNKMKLDMTVDEFKNHLRRIHQWLLSR